MYGPHCDIRVLYVWSILWYQSSVCMVYTVISEYCKCMVHIVISEYYTNGPHCDIRVLYVWSTLWCQSSVCLVHIVISNQKAWLSKLWNQSEQQTITIFQFRIRGCIRFVAVAFQSEEQEAQRATYRAPEYNMPPFWGIGQGGHLVFPIGPKNTSLVEDFEILLPVKFHHIPFCGFRGKVENVSANQKPGWPSCFSDRPKKHKLGRGRYDPASCQVSSNSVQQFQRRSRKCLSQSEGRAAVLFFRLARKTHTL